MKLNGFQKRNVLNIKPFRAPGDDERSPEPGPSKRSTFSVFEAAKDKTGQTMSGSTPKRSSVYFEDCPKTPSDRPVVLEEEFSPIEMFPYSQSQSVPIVQWNYNAVPKNARGSLRRSRPSRGKMPSPPEIKPPKRRTPSPTVEDMPPLKKSSQECVSALQEQYLKLQAIVSDSKDSDDDESDRDRTKETEEERLGTSMHQSLHISDKFERSAASPDLFDSASDEFENVFELKPAEHLNSAVATPNPSTNTCSAASTVPKSSLQCSPQEMSFEVDDSLAECLIACTEKVEAEVRLSQKQQEVEPEVPKFQAAPVAKKSPKKVTPKKGAKEYNNGVQRGKLKVVKVTSPKKNSAPSSSQKKTCPTSKSDSSDFSPHWLENIKIRSSPLNSSNRGSQIKEKSTHRALSFGTQGSKESESPVPKHDNSKVATSSATKVALDKSLDPFEDSFEPNLDDLCAAEAQALSQMACTQKAVEKAPSGTSTVIKPPVQQVTMQPPVSKNIQSFSKNNTFVKPALQKPSTIPKAAFSSTFQRHQSAPVLNKHQPQFSKVAQNNTQKLQTSGAKFDFQSKIPQSAPSSKPPPAHMNFKMTKPPAVTAHPQKPFNTIPLSTNKIMPTVKPIQMNQKLASAPTKAFGSDPTPALLKPNIVNHLKSSPLIRHKSADVLGNKMSSAVNTAASNNKIGGTTFARHKSAEFGQVQPTSQKYSQQEIERKRLEAKKRLAEKNRNGLKQQ